MGIEGGGTCRGSEDFYDLLHLSTLKRNGLLIVHLNLFSLKNRFQCKKFRKNTSQRPHISSSAFHIPNSSATTTGRERNGPGWGFEGGTHCGGVMFRTEE